MGRKVAVALANPYMAEIEKKMLNNESRIKPKIWKRYIDNVFSLWDINRQDIDLFIEQGNTLHPAIKFTADISEKEITFLDTVVYKSERFLKEAILQKRKIAQRLARQSKTLEDHVPLPRNHMESVLACLLPFLKANLVSICHEL